MKQLDEAGQKRILDYVVKNFREMLDECQYFEITLGKEAFRMVITKNPDNGQIMMYSKGVFKLYEEERLEVKLKELEKIQAEVDELKNMIDFCEN